MKLLAAGDTGFSSAKTYDLEVWAPGRRQVARGARAAACSPTSRRAARTSATGRRTGEKPRFVHTLNGSGLAFPRVIACLLEHYQQPDGTRRVPEALRPYLGDDALRPAAR